MDNRQDFVHHQDFRIQVGSYRERQADVHSAGVMLHRSVKKFFDFGESNDLIEALGDFGLAHPQNRAIQKDVFPARQFGMKPGTYFEQTSHPATQRTDPLGGTSDPRQYL